MRGSRRCRRQQRQLRAALRENPDAARQFLLTIEGLSPREAFFNPANMQRVMSGLGGAGPAKV